jgi:hypothetical protein
MLSWLRGRRETAERIDAEADVLIDELGVEACRRPRLGGPAPSVWLVNAGRFDPNDSRRCGIGS